MDGLNPSQQKVVNDVLSLLQTHNVDPKVLHTLSSPRRDADENTVPPHLIQLIALEKASYVAPKAVYFTENERLDGLHRATRVGYVSALLDHPEGAVVEYPESGKSYGEAIAHRFAISALTPVDFIHPRANIQYSLGGSHGGHKDRECYLIRDPETGKPMKCMKHTYTCMSDI